MADIVPGDVPALYLAGKEHRCLPAAAQVTGMVCLAKYVPLDTTARLIT